MRVNTTYGHRREVAALGEREALLESVRARKRDVCVSQGADVCHMRNRAGPGCPRSYTTIGLNRRKERSSSKKLKVKNPILRVTPDHLGWGCIHPGH